MQNFKSVLTKDEIAVFTLRALYNEYGFSHYKMSKFEEYDLYVKNKDFLVSDNVITFTDTDGRLLALKPDVTLSIIKNSKDFNGLTKLCYDEKVYRVSKGTKTFKEITQVGLECFGEVTSNTVAEVLFLAGKSLDLISPKNVLEVSHLDTVNGLLNAFNISDFGKKEIFKYLGQKNSQAVLTVCDSEGLTDDKKMLVNKLVNLYGKIDVILSELDVFIVDEVTKNAVAELKSVLIELKNRGLSNKICVDFSVVNDMNYYNGFAFKGFIEGIPTGVLSGGQYDNLMVKMQKKCKAIGFAVYLDELGKLSSIGE